MCRNDLTSAAWSTIDFSTLEDVEGTELDNDVLFLGRTKRFRATKQKAAFDGTSHATVGKVLGRFEKRKEPNTTSGRVT